MKHIKLSGNLITSVDDEDFDYLNKYKWYTNNSGHVVRTDYTNGKKTIFMHRVVLNATDSRQIDHINRNPLDNQKQNLRFCTHLENSRNQKPKRGPYKGVHFDKATNKWRAQICINRRNKHLGLFNSEIDAAKAYDVAARDLFKEFAYTNFS